MPNVLDLRRRIRSVRNTRQITKAMKMVAAAKLRRAQERMTQARPYAVMLATVLASLRRRAESIDPAENAVRSPLLEVRPEKDVLLVVVSGDKGFAGAFSTNITRASARFLLSTRERDPEIRVDIEAIGRKGRDFFRRGYPTAQLPEQPRGEVAQFDVAPDPTGARAPRPAGVAPYWAASSAPERRFSERGMPTMLNPPSTKCTSPVTPRDRSDRR